MIKTKKLKIIFMGTPDFALPSLESLVKADNFEVVAVVTQEDKKVGRKQEIQSSPVKKMALEHGLTVLQPTNLKKNPEFSTLLKDLKADFIVVVAYGKLLPKAILDLPKYGCINVHASLLPKYRGASPIEQALIEGDQETGISIMKMVEKLDAGPVYFLKKLAIVPAETSLTLRVKLALLGGASLPNILTEIAEGNLEPLAQAESKASYCQKISKEDGKINLESLTADQILNRIKAYTPWPTCSLDLGGKNLKILEAEIDIHKNADPGKIIELDKNTIAFGTKKGLLIPKKVQLEGKSAMPIQAFLAGNRNLLKASLASPK